MYSFWFYYMNLRYSSFCCNMRGDVRSNIVNWNRKCEVFGSLRVEFLDIFIVFLNMR